MGPEPLRAGKDTLITARIIIRDRAGDVLDDLHESPPARFLFGSGRFPAGFYEGLEGMAPGEHRTVTVPPEKGYGLRDKEKVIRVRAGELPDPPPEIGTVYRKKTGDLDLGEPHTVIGQLDGWVWLDKNHPWAGKELCYEVWVVSVARTGGRRWTCEGEKQGDRS
jgi:FKBP-type peptidyl-prolyl cis-trans isomerase 2